MLKIVFLLLIIVMFYGQNCLAFNHVTCSELNLLPEKDKVLVIRSLVGGLGVALGLVESAVRAVNKDHNPDVALGANLTKSGTEHYISALPNVSEKELAQKLDQKCMKGDSGRQAASALLDILMAPI